MAGVYLIISIRGRLGTAASPSTRPRPCQLLPMAIACRGGPGHWPARPPCSWTRRDEHEQTGPPSQVSTTLEFHVRHCQRQPHAGRTKAPSHVPDNLEHVYESRRSSSRSRRQQPTAARKSTRRAAPVAQPCRSAEPAGSSPRFQSAVRGGRANDQAAQIRSGPTTPPD